MKRIVCFFLCALLCFCLPACGGTAINLVSSQTDNSVLSSPVELQAYRQTIPFSLSFEYITPILPLDNREDLERGPENSRLMCISASSGDVWSLLDFATGKTIVQTKLAQPDGTKTGPLFAHVISFPHLYPPGDIYLSPNGDEIEEEQAGILVKQAVPSFSYYITMDGMGILMFYGNGMVKDTASGKTYYYEADDIMVYLLEERESPIGDIDADVCRFAITDTDPHPYFGGSDVDNFLSDDSGFAYEKKWGLCRLDGTELYPPVLSWHDYTNVNGSIVAYRAGNGLYGYINTETGSVISDPLYSPMWTSFYRGNVSQEFPTLFHEGLAPVRINGRVGYINTQGETVIAPQFEDASYVYQSKAWVKQNGLWGQIEFLVN